MLDDAKRAEIDQMVAGYATMPLYLYANYSGCIKAGFSEEQAFELTRCMVLSAFRRQSESGE